MNRVRFLFLLFFLSQIISYSQFKSIDVSGVVTEYGSGEVLIGVNLVFYKDSLKTSPPIRGAATNKYGFFSIPDVPAGEYYLFISLMGYETLIKKVSLSSNQKNLRTDFQLSKSTLTLKEVVIEDRRKTDFSNTTSTIQIEPELIKQLPSIGGETDIFRALQLLPGVKSATEISSGIYVRGSSPDQNLNLVDGVLVYNPAHLGGFASTFNADALQNVKLIKGGFPAEYGGRLASVLDVTMKSGNDSKFKGSLGLNLISSRLTIEGPLSNKSTFILSGRKMFLDKVLQMIPKMGNIPRYNFYDLNGKVNYVISEEDRIFFSGFVSRDNLGEPPNNKDVGFDISWTNATFNLTWTSINSAKLFSNTSLMYTSYNFTTLIKDKIQLKNPLDFYTSSEIHDLFLRRDMQLFADETHTLKTGAELIYHMFTTTTSDYFIQELKYKPFYGKNINVLEASLYVQDELSLFGDLKTNIGGRIYYFQANKFLKFEPRVSATYYLMDRLILRGAFTIAYQTLHMLVRNDILLPTDTWYPSSSKIDPSRAIQGSIGIEATSFERTFLFSFDTYYKDISNLYDYKISADFSYGSDFEKQLTKGRADAFGFELFLNKRIGDVNGWIGYTLAYTKRYFNELNQGVSFYPRFDRRHDISVVISYEPFTNFNSSITWTYSTGQAYSLPNGQYSFIPLTSPESNTYNVYYDYSRRDAYRLPPFHKLDLNAKYIVMWDDKSLEFSLNIYNLYNRYNIFSKYIGYKKDPATKEEIPVLKQFTLFPFLPTLGIAYRF